MKTNLYVTIYDNKQVKNVKCHIEWSTITFEAKNSNYDSFSPYISFLVYETFEKPTDLVIRDIYELLKFLQFHRIEGRTKGEVFFNEKYNVYCSVYEGMYLPTFIHGIVDLCEFLERIT